MAKKKMPPMFGKKIDKMENSMMDKKADKKQMGKKPKK